MVQFKKKRGIRYIIYKYGINVIILINQPTAKESCSGLKTIKTELVFLVLQKSSIISSTLS